MYAYDFYDVRKYDAAQTYEQEPSAILTTFFEIEKYHAFACSVRPSTQAISRTGFSDANALVEHKHANTTAQENPILLTQPQ